MKYNNFSFYRMSVTPRHKSDCLYCGVRPKRTRIVLGIADGYFAKQSNYIFCSVKCFQGYMAESLSDTREAQKREHGRLKEKMRLYRKLRKQYPDIQKWDYERYRTVKTIERKTIDFGTHEESVYTFEFHDMETGEHFIAQSWNQHFFDRRSIGTEGSVPLGTKRVFHSDSGHGWLEVPIEDLETLGIASEISMCSYVKGKMAFLEEDVDAKLYIMRFADKWGFVPSIDECLIDGESAIRGYERYRAPVKE